MNQRKKDIMVTLVLLVFCGLMTWHVVHWHCTGMYLEMFRWIETDKAYLTVLYDLGLMLVLGVVLGFLMEKITELIGYAVGEIKQFDRGNQQQ